MTCFFYYLGFGVQFFIDRVGLLFFIICSEEWVTVLGYCIGAVIGVYSVEKIKPGFDKIMRYKPAWSERRRHKREL